MRRRSFLAFLPFAGAAAVVKPAEPAADPHERVRRDTEALAASMAAVHGGPWRAMVDHETKFVVLRPQYSGEAGRRITVSVTMEDGMEVRYG